jgi:hypothetical protein
MKKLVAVCLGAILSASVFAAPCGSKLEFALVEQFGDPNARSFFVFSTAAGNYVIRHDGMGEFTSPSKMRRAFFLKVPARRRISSMYFLEHERDLLLHYEVSGQGSYLVRLEQTKRKQRWSTTFETQNIEAPVIDGDYVFIKDGERRLQISKTDGRIL